MIRKEIMVPKIIDICPYCEKEIGEKELFCPDINQKPIIWIHRPCGNKFLGID